jgi:lipopolysaccharide export system permease protein
LSDVTIAATLSLYISRVFVLSVLGALAGLSGLFLLFDFIELLRRSSTKPDATFGVVAEIAGLHVPWSMMEILPFAILVGGILCFWRLTRSSELVVARAAGVSAWQFLAAPVFVAVAFGGIATAVVSPISAAMRARAESLDAAYLRVGSGPLELNGGQLWLRQRDTGLVPGGVAILHATGVTLRDGKLVVTGVSVFRMDSKDTFLERIEASEARLDDGEWVMADASTIRPDHLPAPEHSLTLSTDLTVDRVQESFAPPDTFSVWALPGFIEMLDRSGFSSIRHRLHFQSLLALPLLAGTMALVAAGFSMRPTRRGGVAQMIGSGVAAGFMLFALTKVVGEFGDSGALPPVLAAWAPAAAGLLLSVSLLLHLEDG